VLKVAIATFATVFLAELGDKTQLATMLLVAQGKSPLAVFLGSASALVVSSLVGVLAGGVVAKYIPEIWVRIAAGSGFIILGVLLLLGRF
jgi:putative Ca2+/H+ antiporter (TMEM165/GDT1 family)